MKRLHKILLAGILVLTVMMGFAIGLWAGMNHFSRVRVLGEQELQDHIYEVTEEYKEFFRSLGFEVKQSHIVGSLWIQCEKFNEFVILAQVTGATTIYVHWKTEFLMQPVFFIWLNQTSITYEPF